MSWESEEVSGTCQRIMGDEGEFRRNQGRHRTLQGISGGFLRFQDISRGLKGHCGGNTERNILS